MQIRVFTAALVMGAMSFTAQARPLSVELNGQPLDGDPPLMQQGRVLVPLRNIFQALGAEVRFDAAAKTIRAQRGATVVELTLGQTAASISGRAVTLEVPAAALDGKTYVPLRFVAEALGSQVAWDGAASTVRIQDGPVSFNPRTDLKRLMVGHQAGILKVFDAQRKEVFNKGLDDRSFARYTDETRGQLFQALSIDPNTLSDVSERLMASFETLPAKEAMALLGAIGSGNSLSAPARQKLQDFAANTMTSHKDVVVRRQALLTLAVMESPLPQTVERVTRFYEQSDNLWETFPVQQFFEYHAGSVRSLPEYSRIRERLSRVSSLYTPNVLGYLDGRDKPNSGY